MKKGSESSLQSSCIMWFRLQFPEFKELLFAIPNGGSRNVIEAANLKKQGVLAGVADCFLAVPNELYHGCFIEFKFGKNKQSDCQLTFEKACSKLGYKYLLIYDFESFKCEVSIYMNKALIKKVS